MSESIAAKIQNQVASWPGVTVEPHQFGGVEFRIGRRELGHLHGSRLADFPFPVKVRDELIASHRAKRHHVLPNSAWVSAYIESDKDVETIIELFRLDYERPVDTVPSTVPRTTGPPLFLSKVILPDTSEPDCVSDHCASPASEAVRRYT